MNKQTSLITNMAESSVSTDRFPIGTVPFLVRICPGTPERGAGGSSRPSCLSVGGAGGAEVLFLNAMIFLFLHAVFYGFPISCDARHVIYSFNVYAKILRCACAQSGKLFFGKFSDRNWRNLLPGHLATLMLPKIQSSSTEAL